MDSCLHLAARKRDSCRWKDVQQIQLVTHPDAFNGLSTAEGIRSGCTTSPRIVNYELTPCSAVTGQEGISFDVSDLKQGQSTMFTIRRPVPKATTAGKFSLEHICAQNVLPIQKVLCCLVYQLSVGWPRFSSPVFARTALVKPTCLL